MKKFAYIFIHHNLNCGNRHSAIALEIKGIPAFDFNMIYCLNVPRVVALGRRGQFLDGTTRAHPAGLLFVLALPIFIYPQQSWHFNRGLPPYHSHLNTIIFIRCWPSTKRSVICGFVHIMGFKGGSFGKGRGRTSALRWPTA